MGLIKAVGGFAIIFLIVSLILKHAPLTKALDKCGPDCDIQTFASEDGKTICQHGISQSGKVVSLGCHNAKGYAY